MFRPTPAFRRTAGSTYDSLRSGFSWNVPTRLNLGVACCDAQASSAVALIEARDTDVRMHTFGVLADQSNRLANGLAALRIGRGDRVAIMLPQGLHAAVAHLATFKLGAVSVPMTPLFGVDAVAYRLDDSGARVVIGDASVSEIVVSASEGRDVEVVLADEPSGPHHDFADLVARGSSRFEATPTGPDDPAILIYTSGTTGWPKGALHGHRIVHGHLPGYQLMYDFFPRGQDRVWTPADWAWIGGLLNAVLPAWFHGRPVIAAPRTKFDPQWAMDLLRAHGVTVAALPATALRMLQTAQVRADGLALRALMTGGEPLGGELMAWARANLTDVVNEIYGQTEANLLVGNCVSVWPARPGSMGRPYPGHDVAVLGDSGQLVGSGTTGELVSRASDPVHMLRYWQRPKATAAKYVDVVDPEGATHSWLRTGDLGHVDDDGYLWFTARSDDVITSAGYRIGPTEIEETLAAHPSVAMAAVIGIPDELRGQVVKAFVQLVDGVAGDDALRTSLRDHVRSHLAAYEYPREIEFIAALPMTTTDKIRRAQLREQSIAVADKTTADDP